MIKRPFQWLKKGWIQFGMALGWVNSRILLGAMFFFVFTPLALIFRVAGRDSLHRKWDPNRKSYREKRDSEDPSKTMMRPY